jgi:hypothetical protein
MDADGALHGFHRNTSPRACSPFALLFFTSGASTTVLLRL